MRQIRSSVKLIDNEVETQLHSVIDKDNGLDLLASLYLGSDPVEKLIEKLDDEEQQLAEDKEGNSCDRREYNMKSYREIEQIMQEIKEKRDSEGLDRSNY